jgi:hypothetical protein
MLGFAVIHGEGERLREALQTAGHGGMETVNDARKRQKLDWLRDLEALRSPAKN